MDVSFERVPVEPTFRPVKLTLTFESSRKVETFHHLISCWSKQTECGRPALVHDLAKEIEESEAFKELLRAE